MDVLTQDQRNGRAQPGRVGPVRRREWRRAWPAALGVVVAAGTAYGLTDGRDIAPVVAASGLVYLAAAATGRRRAAWVAFAVTFALITLDKFAGLDATPWLLAIAVVLLAVGLAGRRTGPWWSLPLQASAMLVLGATALLAVRLDATAGGLLVAGGTPRPCRLGRPPPPHGTRRGPLARGVLLGARRPRRGLRRRRRSRLLTVAAAQASRRPGPEGSRTHVVDHESSVHPAGDLLDMGPVRGGDGIVAA
ncbi:hypothetical protein MF406_10860 [Georgenia sp. TF02-10]|uniref:hypothetical protein n=1 Tax=Georgenia sp. TF02-10 TaxID=2917725 RepID=UPI001FA6AD50|nr:hypothetical protein [Georgenia sp. TF02-10]UNX53497.1 hypothetical protein MF406_10860 [Georgenia sp. TF02-10]